MTGIGKRIKQARLNKGLTQQQLADMCGFTKGLISQIENGKTSSAVATLSKIAKKLEVPLSWMLEDSPQNKLTILPRANRIPSIGDQKMGYAFEMLANRSPYSKIEPLLVSVHPDEPPKSTFTHDEDEFIYVINGSIDLWYDGQTHRIGEGDSAYFEGSTPHVFLPVNKTEAKVLSIYVQSY
ncbi:helix-turn-helix domain-containing protein [Lentibacillus sp. N15]|uniref:helix-turn-helix domain-containing protein n=1 Tax=Lentibacillus songyuanensis TaxID=3136161 RepID=UPI0031BAE4EB